MAKLLASRRARSMIAAKDGIRIRKISSVGVHHNVNGDRLPINRIDESPVIDTQLMGRSQSSYPSACRCSERLEELHRA